MRTGVAIALLVAAAACRCETQRPSAAFRASRPSATSTSSAPRAFALRSGPPLERAFRKVTLTMRDGVLEGASPAVIDAIDAAFVARIDLLAVLRDGDIVAGWFDGERLVAATAPVFGKTVRVGYFDGQVRGWFDDGGVGMDGRFLSRPVAASRITSRYGVRFHPVDKRVSLHSGTDYGAAIGTPVVATSPGRVVTCTRDASAGLHIKLRHEGGAETLYLHLSAIAAGLQRGTTVRAGDIIGFVGSTGKSTGPHLHYELRFAGVAVDATRTIPYGLTALGPSELQRHRAFLDALP